MSIDLYKRGNARESEFKGNNGDIEKYGNPKSWKVTVTAWIIILGICAVGYTIFF